MLAPSTKRASSEAHAVVEFWREAGLQTWFTQNDVFDVLRFRSRFLALYERAAAGELDLLDHEPDRYAGAADPARSSSRAMPSAARPRSMPPTPMLAGSPMARWPRRPDDRPRVAASSTCHSGTPKTSRTSGAPMNWWSTSDRKRSAKPRHEVYRHHRTLRPLPASTGSSGARRPRTKSCFSAMAAFPAEETTMSIMTISGSRGADG